MACLHFAASANENHCSYVDAQPATAAASLEAVAGGDGAEAPPPPPARPSPAGPGAGRDPDARDYSTWMRPEEDEFYSVLNSHGSHTVKTVCHVAHQRIATKTLQQVPDCPIATRPSHDL